MGGCEDASALEVGLGVSLRLSMEGEVRSKTEGNHLDRSARIAGKQAQIKVT